MPSFASTPQPPYYAVIFTAKRSAGDNGYAAMLERLLASVVRQPGFLGMESAHAAVGITVCYWSDLASIRCWKENAEHQQAQRLGCEKWYAGFRIRIAKVEREYGL